MSTEAPGGISVANTRKNNYHLLF